MAFSPLGFWTITCPTSTLQKNYGFFQGPPIVGPPSHKLPIPFPYFKGFLWEWYGSSMGMGVPLLGVPRISLEKNQAFLQVTAMNGQFPTQRTTVELQLRGNLSTKVEKRLATLKMKHRTGLPAYSPRKVVTQRNDPGHSPHGQQLMDHQKKQA